MTTFPALDPELASVAAATPELDLTDVTAARELTDALSDASWATHWSSAELGVDPPRD